VAQLADGDIKVGSSRTVGRIRIDAGGERVSCSDASRNWSQLTSSS